MAFIVGCTAEKSRYEIVKDCDQIYFQVTDYEGNKDDAYWHMIEKAKEYGADYFDVLAYIPPHFTVGGWYDKKYTIKGVFYFCNKGWL